MLKLENNKLNLTIKFTFRTGSQVTEIEDTIVSNDIIFGLALVRDT